MRTNSMKPERIAELREVSSDGDDFVPNASIMTELLDEVEKLTTLAVNSNLKEHK